MGALKDRIRFLYEKSKSLDPNMTLADLGISPNELGGSYTDASNFSMHVESVEPPGVLVIYRQNFAYQSPDNYLRCELNTGKTTVMETAAPPGLGKTVWPEHKRFDEELQRAFDSLIRKERYWLLDAVVSIVIGVLMALGLLRVGNGGRDLKWPAALIFGGYGLVVYLTILLPDFHVRLRSKWIADLLFTALFVSLLPITLGAFMVKPYNAPRRWLALIGFIPLLAVIGNVAAASFHSAGWGVATMAFSAGLLFLLIGIRSARHKAKS